MNDLPDRISGGGTDGLSGSTRRSADDPPLSGRARSAPAERRWPRARVLWAVALAAWAALIARITLVPEIGGTGTIYRLVAGVAAFLTGGKMVPTFLVVEGIGNVLMFVPYGLLWTVVLAYPALTYPAPAYPVLGAGLPNAGARHVHMQGAGAPNTAMRRLVAAFTLAVAVSLASSWGIELAQGAFFADRVSETRDVLHNTLGGVVGAALVLAYGWRRSLRMPQQTQCRP